MTQRTSASIKLDEVATQLQMHAQNASFVLATMRDAFDEVSIDASDLSSSIALARVSRLLDVLGDYMRALQNESTEVLNIQQQLDTPE